MDTSTPAPSRRRLALASILLIFSLACLCMPASPFGTSTPSPSALPSIPTPLPTISPSPTQISSPPATLPPVPTPAPQAPLTAQGPWLLIETSQGLWAANQDGSGLTQLTDVDYWHGDLQDAIQPGGHEIAFISPGGFDFHHLALNLLSLPKGDVIPITDLTSPATEAYADSGPGDPGFEALRAIGEQRSLAWSPDGSKLAFVGAMDGPSADLYIYDDSADQVSQLSDDPAQDFWPSWSPGGSHLVYFGAEGFGTGAGMVMSGVWDVPRESKTPVRLYEPAGSGDMIAGWLNDTTAVLASSNMECGPVRLRLYEVVKREESMLNEGCFTSASATGFRSAALFANDQGLFLLTDENRTPQQVSQEKNAFILPWGPDDYVFRVHFADGRTATFGPGTHDNQVTPVTAARGTSLIFDQQDVAMYGAIWAWTSQNENQSGVWITGPGIDIGRIFDRSARFPAWSPHNNLLFFAPLEGGYELYLTTFDSHYTDLHPVNHLDADILGVVWLGAG